MRRVGKLLVSAVAAGALAVPAGVRAAPQPPLVIEHLSSPGSGIAGTLLPVIVTLNQPVQERKVWAQRLAAGRWTTIDEIRVAGTQVSVPVRLRGVGAELLRLLVLDPAGQRWVVSRAFTVRVTRATLPMLPVEPCSGFLTAAHDGRRLWTLCLPAEGDSSLNDGGRHRIGRVTSFTLRGRQVWMVRDTDVLVLDGSSDELLAPIPLGNGPNERPGAIASGPSGVWVLASTVPPGFGLGDEISSTLIRIDPDALAVTDRIPLPPSSSLVASGPRVGARNVWMARVPIFPHDGRDIADYLRVNPATRAVTRLGGGDTLAASGPGGIFAIRRLVTFPSRSGGTLRRIDPVPTSYRPDISRLSLRSLGVGPSTLWGLTFRETRPSASPRRYLAARLDPHSGRAIGALRAVGPLVNPFGNIQLVMIGDRAWVLFQGLGVMMRVP
jgi:hypothetical protein